MVMAKSHRRIRESFSTILIMARGGFSLVELLVVVSIALILLAVAIVPGIGSTRNRAYEHQASTHGAVVSQAIANYLSINLSTDVGALISSWPGADLAQKPAGLALNDPRDCARARTLSGEYRWPDASDQVGCAVEAITSGAIRRIVVYTWRKGSSSWYENGEKRP